MKHKYLPPTAEITWLESAAVLLSSSTEAGFDNTISFKNFFNN